MDLKFPETPVLVAGGVGGPTCYYTVTPLRNACTLGATNATASALSLYRQVFSTGFARGWTGGIYPSMYACPTFIILGPVYYAFKSMVGAPGAVVLASASESLILFGAETCNAQMAKNNKVPGSIKNIQPSWKPYGAGIGIHITRNILGTAGLRLFCGPCTSAWETVSGTSNGSTQLAGDFTGNVIAACLTAPVHQLYGFVVSTPELQTMAGAEKRDRMMRFLKEQYLVTDGGKTRLSANVPRDLFMRSAYVATLYTMFSTVERTLIGKWPEWFP